MQKLHKNISVLEYVKSHTSHQEINKNEVDCQLLFESKLPLQELINLFNAATQKKESLE